MSTHAGSSTTASLAPAVAQPVTTQEQRVITRVIGRLMPFLFLCYLVAYIDRVNIGFAKAVLLKDLAINNVVYGVGASIFFVGYVLFEIPSNLAMRRFGARTWIARILITWGLISMAFMFIQGKWSFYGLRVLLGIAEAGFFPGVVLYLTYWIPARHRAKTAALFMMAIPVAILVGAPLSAALLKMHGALGLKGWQWLFLVEGLPAVILGVVALFWLTDRPEKAHWLAASDREWLGAELAREAAQRSRSHLSWGALANPKVLALCFFYLLNNTATYGVFFFLPDILAQKTGYGGFALAAITAIPFVGALIGMVLIGRHSDRTGERKWHVAACALAAAVGVALTAWFSTNVVMLVLSVTLLQIGQRSLLGVFWAIPPIFLAGTAAAAGIALINSVGTIGGAVGPTVVGWLRQGSSGYTSGLLVLAATLALEAIIMASLSVPKESAVKSGSSA
jgi:ACS family tartrate transporter-like MFS transporter